MKRIVNKAITFIVKAIQRKEEKTRCLHVNIPVSEETKKPLPYVAITAHRNETLRGCVAQSYVIMKATRIAETLGRPLMARIVEIGIEESEDLGDITGFIEEARTACLLRGVVFFFECPLCGAQAKATQSKSNGHLHAYCDSCMTQVME